MIDGLPAKSVLRSTYDHWIQALPGCAGSYALILQNNSEVPIRVGRAGSFVFKPGVYIYFGSAKGPGGIHARVARHLRMEKKLHWHVDYVLDKMSVVGLGYRAGEERYECVWSRYAISRWGALMLAAGLGASDCREKCPAHLFYLSGTLDIVQQLSQEMALLGLEC